MEKESPSRRLFGLPLTIIAVGAIVAGVFLFSDVSRPPPAGTPVPNAIAIAPTGPAVAGVRIDPGVVEVADTDPVAGRPDAPQTIILFTQFHCAFCQHFFTATWPQLKENFIDTGRARLVFKVFPIGDNEQDTQQAQQAAAAAYCAQQQDAFWPYVNHLFAAGAGYETADLTAYATAEGLTKEQFVACLKSGAYAETVAGTIRAAVAAGVTATPAFIIDNQLYEGALSYAELERLLH